MSLKYSVLVVSEMLRLFVNILRSDEKYSLSVKASVYRDQFKSNYLKLKNIFQIFFLYFRILDKILNPSEKRRSLRDYWLLKL